MVDLYAILIMHGKKTINQVPKKLRQQVIERLADLGLDENGNPLEP